MAYFTWGQGATDQLGHGDGTENQVCTVPRVVFALAEQRIFVSDFSCGIDHMAALTTSSEVYSWEVISPVSSGGGSCVSSRRDWKEKL